MVLERWTNPKPQRHTCSSRYGYRCVEGNRELNMIPPETPAVPIRNLFDRCTSVPCLRGVRRITAHTGAGPAGHAVGGGPVRSPTTRVHHGLPARASAANGPHHQPLGGGLPLRGGAHRALRGEEFRAVGNWAFCGTGRGSATAGFGYRLHLPVQGLNRQIFSG
jgi:hypothetical protein